MQAPLPSVGDTIWMLRLVRVPAGAEVRAPDWTPEGPIERLGAARLTRRGDQVEVAWPLVGWTPGAHDVEVPGPLLIYADGREDTLAAQSSTITVTSVLPASNPAKLEPQPRAGYVDRGATSVLPVLLALLVAALLLTPVLLWRRRKRAPVPQPPASPAVAMPLDAWRRAGERELLLERLVSALQPRAGDAAVATWLADADAARFAAVDASAREALLVRGDELVAGRPA